MFVDCVNQGEKMVQVKVITEGTMTAQKPPPEMATRKLLVTYPGT